MKLGRRAWLALAIAALAVGGVGWWTSRATYHYLDGDTAPYVALFPPPPPADSAQTRGELDELLALQNSRTAAEVAAARADRKTEVSRFFEALGVAETASLPRVRRLADRVEDDGRLYVRAAKDAFRRLRPPEIDARLRPCISNVRSDLSYPSGHASYAYLMAGTLARLAPARSAKLFARADEFARQRMVCGVHFRSDLEAGRRGAQWLLDRLARSPAYLEDEAAARAELAALAPR